MLRVNRAASRMTRREDPEPDFAGALADAREALRLDPRRAEEWVAIGIVRVAQATSRAGEGDDWAGAEAALGRAIELDAGLAEAWMRRGNVRYLRSDAKDLPGAIADWEQALRIDPRLQDRIGPRLKDARDRIR